MRPSFTIKSFFLYLCAVTCCQASPLIDVIEQRLAYETSISNTCFTGRYEYIECCFITNSLDNRPKTESFDQKKIDGVFYVKYSNSEYTLTYSANMLGLKAPVTNRVYYDGRGLFYSIDKDGTRSKPRAVFKWPINPVEILQLSDAGLGGGYAGNWASNINNITNVNGRGDYIEFDIERTNGMRGCFKVDKSSGVIVNNEARENISGHEFLWFTRHYDYERSRPYPHRLCITNYQYISLDGRAQRIPKKIIRFQLID